MFLSLSLSRNTDFHVYDIHSLFMRECLLDGISHFFVSLSKYSFAAKHFSHFFVPIQRVKSHRRDIEWGLI